MSKTLKSAKKTLKAVTVNDADRAKRYLEFAYEQLQHREYYKVKQLCAQVIRALRR